eukprot:GHVU01096758.1.p1 GENE.GHVU01096758.1~~GHVU01096758.1.p1  ORF type:complete len:323 (-),score=49.39 GHVU01096758.1:240-1208(-)
MAVTQWWYTGMSSYGEAGYVKASNSFRSDDIPRSLVGFEYLITGANSGIGFAAAKELASRGARVHMLCRNKEKGEAAMQQIRDAFPEADVNMFVADVSSKCSLRHFAREFAGTCDKLNALINNAGSMPAKREVTEDGNERCFATMAGGVYLLTSLLLPQLRAGRPSRVVNVSSGGMYPVKMDTRDFQQHHGGQYDGTYAYAQAKRAMLYLTEKWAATSPAEESGISFYSCHPGWVDTEGVRVESMKWFYESRLRPRLRRPEQGADTVVWLAAATGDALSNAASGEFFFDRQIAPKHFRFSRTRSSESDVEQLWKECEAMFVG